jgi:hypothetical protein
MTQTSREVVRKAVSFGRPDRLPLAKGDAADMVPIQTTIHDIADDQIEHEVERLVRRPATPAGGLIATYYHQPDLNLPVEKVAHMWQAFQRFRW